MKKGPGFHPPERITRPEQTGYGVTYYPPGTTDRDVLGYIAGVAIGDYVTGSEGFTREEIEGLIAALQECIRRADATD